MAVNHKDVPPILTIGKGWPVTGKIPTATAILLKACRTNPDDKPITRRTEKSLLHFRAIFMLLNKNIKYIKMVNIPPITP